MKTWKKTSKTEQNTNETDDKFTNKKIYRSKLTKEPKYDLSLLYDKANEEMVAQQTKRDQIITFYLAMFSIVLPVALSAENVSIYIKGGAFFLVAVIGWMLALIIVRYRVYKEAYWLCCQAITNLMNFEQSKLDKKTIQAVYYRCMRKKAKSYLVGEEKKFSKKLFFKKNIFSGETIYFLIHTLLTALMAALSAVLLFSFIPAYNIVICVILFLIIMMKLIKLFFDELVSIYSVIYADTNSSFNIAFSKAWFLHIYMDEEDFYEDEESDES